MPEGVLSTAYRAERTLCLLLGLLTIPTIGRGQQAEVEPLTESPLSLEAVLAVARARNPEIAAARQLWAAARERPGQVSRLPDPQFKLTLWSIPSNTANPFEAREDWYGLEQRLPWPGKLAAAGDIASREADVLEARFGGVEQEVVARASGAYYELYYAHRALAIHREHLELLQQFSRVAQTKYATGTRGQADALRAAVAVSKVVNLLVTLEQERATAVAALNVLLDRLPQAPLGVPIPPEPEPLPLSLEDLQGQALQARPELVAARQAVARDEAALRLARRQYWPDLEVTGSFWDVQTDEDRWMATFALSLPFAPWAKGKYDHGVQEAEARLVAASAGQRAVRNAVFFEIQDALVRLDTARRLGELYRTSVLPQTRQTLAAVTASYRTDRADFLTMLDTEEALLEFELDEARYLADFGRRLAELKRAVGRPLTVSIDTSEEGRE